MQTGFWKRMGWLCGSWMTVAGVAHGASRE